MYKMLLRDLGIVMTMKPFANENTCSHFGSSHFGSKSLKLCCDHDNQANTFFAMSTMWKILQWISQMGMGVGKQLLGGVNVVVVCFSHVSVLLIICVRPGRIPISQPMSCRRLGMRNTLRRQLVQAKSGLSVNDLARTALSLSATGGPESLRTTLRAGWAPR